MKTLAEIKAECPAPDFEEWQRQRDHGHDEPEARPERVQVRQRAQSTGVNDFVTREALAATFYEERQRMIDLVVRETDELRRELADCRKREKLSEDRLRALEDRAAKAEERLARVEERQLAPLTSSLPAHTGRAH